MMRVSLLKIWGKAFQTEERASQRCSDEAKKEGMYSWDRVNEADSGRQVSEGAWGHIT